MTTKNANGHHILPVGLCKMDGLHFTVMLGSARLPIGHEQGNRVGSRNLL